MAHPTLTHAAASLRAYSGTYEAHAHGHAQVLVGLHGSLQLELDGHSAFVDASCALIVPAGVTHGYMAERPARVLVIDAPAARALDRVRRFVPPNAWRRAGAIDPQASVDGLDAVARAPSLQARRRLDLSLVDRALADGLHQPWTTARLAALCHLSPQRFHARFVELTGLAPAAYVRRRRLDEAVRLLRSGFTLEASAPRTGYASASALAYALRRERGFGVRDLRS
jgi:AraC-like DNA-binding protein